MFCLRYFLLLVLIPTTGASPHFLALLLINLFISHKPCVYCSLLLLALFSTTCYFNDHCFIDTNATNFFLPRLFLPAELGSDPKAVFDTLANRALFTVSSFKKTSFLREFRLPCVAVNVRL
ncbi:hypothetical protein V1512DRAFT_259286 [Lipomyces arxii]|uniref:uncharacterized protein n=1 Tax=Lipomyces arxii TaxID=56418 RepID=UPI0034CF7713